MPDSLDMKRSMLVASTLLGLMLLAGFVIWPTWTKVQYHRFWLWETMREWSKLGGSTPGKIQTR